MKVNVDMDKKQVVPEDETQKSLETERLEPEAQEQEPIQTEISREDDPMPDRRKRIQEQKEQQAQTMQPGVGKRKKYLKYLLISIALLFSIFTFSYVGMEILGKPKFQRLDESYSLLAGDQDRNYELVNLDLPVVKDEENPVNGVLVTSDEYDEMLSRKLVVVSLNNHSLSRPQFGLSKADLVLEVLAEGGITRYNAFYYQNQEVEKIGPIRSARSYMLEFFLGFDDPVFVHEGQASYPVQETPVPETNTLVHISQWGVESMQTAASRYRDKDRIKSAGYVHSLMTGFDLINPEIDRLGWRKSSDISPLKFKFDAPEEERGTVKEIQTNFTSLSTSYYSSKFVYSAENNSYDRYISGEKDTDASTNVQLSPKNVIVEYHLYRDAMDGHSRIILDMIGEDEAYIFRDGEMIKGKWVKNSRTDRTRYFDEEGNEIEFNRGQIWVVNAAKLSSKRISDVYVDGNKL